MAQAIIEARNLGKRYVLQGPGNRTLREAIVQTVRAPLSLFARRGGKQEEFWALKDLSFDIAPGEAVGIIGRNGAGKSTLLKILSRITAPTTGEVLIYGKVASLLEVGTGFHSELSGRENIFLNGAIMGMTRAEVRSRFDEIVAFAEIDKFLDTPVKRYSSGMYIRLAFAVAAHLQPEILIVDEVLAVGDASFQRKCLGKMQSVASGGRTVLFVSHNMAAITRLCTRGILLSHGTMVAEGPVAKIAAIYAGGSHGESATEIDYRVRGRPPGSEHVRLLSARLIGDDPRSTTVDIRHPVVFELEYEVLRSQYPLNPNLHFFNEEGTCVFITSDGYLRQYRGPKEPGMYRARVTIPGNLLSEGMFSVDVAISTPDPVIVHVWERGLFSFSVYDPGEGDSARGTFGGPIPGAVRPMLPWHTEPSEMTVALPSARRESV
jgi:homopolymeric O-antigen transport system ATP-binding protein